MLVFNLNQTLGNYLKEGNLNTLNHSKSMKFNIMGKLCKFQKDYK
jgi:hypothetical protein